METEQKTYFKQQELVLAALVFPCTEEYPGSIQVGIPKVGHPSTWLEGYTNDRDVLGSVELDTWFRETAKGLGVPIDVLTFDEYQFHSLHRDPNEASPNHDVGYVWGGG